MEASNVKQEIILFNDLQSTANAEQIAVEVEKLPEVKSAEIKLGEQRLELEVTSEWEELRPQISAVVQDIAESVTIKRKEKAANKCELKLDGLSCASCAAKIEDNVNQLSNVDQAQLNFSSKKLTVEAEAADVREKIMKETKQVINDLEPEVIVREETEAAYQEEQTVFDEAMKKETARLLSGAFLFGLALILGLTGELILYGLAYLIVGYQVLSKAVKDIGKGQLFDENFLMTIATVGAFGIGEFAEGVAVMLFYEVGELFQQLAVNQSRSSIQELMDIRPDIANLKKAGQVKQVTPEQLAVGDTIVIRAGEKVPVDGRVIDGSAMLDTAALTGESVPQKVEPGDEILSGAVNQDGLLTVEVNKEFEESTVSRILDLVENAASEKAPTENFITKFARYYTPAVVLGALGLAFLPPLLISGAVLSDWVYRALIFLVVSCPCALVVSIPLGFFGGIGSASQQGILIKGGNYLEGLNDLETVVFDKTGTLTEGVFAVQEVVPAEGWEQEELLQAAAKVEYNSNHPIAQSILEAYQGPEIEEEKISDYREIAGKGLRAYSGDREVLAGNHKLMEQEGIDYPTVEEIGTIIYVAVNGNYAGYIVINDQIKSDSKSALQNLRELGIEKLIMLTGDNQQVAARVADELGMDKYYAELLPDEKVAQMEKILEGQENKTAFVGDGINDAPVLARSDIGVAMGGLGSDAAIEAADIVLMKDKPSNLTEAVKVANFTRKIVWQNIALALGVKGAVLLLGALGMATMWEAVFADVGVALLAVLNSIRVIRE